MRVTIQLDLLVIVVIFYYWFAQDDEDVMVDFFQKLKGLYWISLYSQMITDGN